MTPDTFALAQVDLDVEAVRASVVAMAARRQRHPKTPDDVINALSRHLPEAMDALRQRS